MTIYTALTYSFPDLEPVCCSMSVSSYCFLTCIQISQEAGQVVWCSHLLKNFPQLSVIHAVKGFGIINKAEIDVFLEFSCFFYDPMDVVNLITSSVLQNLLLCRVFHIAIYSFSEFLNKKVNTQKDR